MSIPTRICSNCVFTTNCSLNSLELPIYYCEEHSTKTDENQEINIPTNTTKNQEYSGLCSSCDNFVGCFLREENQIIFNCEHYQ